MAHRTTMRRVSGPRATLRATIRATAIGTLASLPLLAACSPDHLYANRGNALQATKATLNDTRLTYRSADPGRAVLGRLRGGERGEAIARERYEDARTPHCDDPLVLNRIKLRTPKETHLTTRHPLYVEEFGHARENRYVPRHGRNQIAQRFCQVAATLSDHSHRTIYYVVETPMGFAGIGHNMEFCIAGLDPWYVHGHRCSSLRHQGPAKAEPLPEERHYGRHPAWDKRPVPLHAPGPADHPRVTSKDGYVYKGEPHPPRRGLLGWLKGHPRAR